HRSRSRQRSTMRIAGSSWKSNNRSPRSMRAVDATFWRSHRRHNGVLMIAVQRPNLGAEELEGVRKVFDTRWLGMGATTKQFEDRIRDYTGAKHVIAVNTGTSALHIALAALDLQRGDEVIVPSLTFVASVQAILSAGGRPVFCEI